MACDRGLQRGQCSRCGERHQARPGPETPESVLKAHDKAERKTYFKTIRPFRTHKAQRRLDATP